MSRQCDTASVWITHKHTNEMLQAKVQSHSKTLNSHTGQPDWTQIAYGVLSPVGQIIPTEWLVVELKHVNFKYYYWLLKLTNYARYSIFKVCRLSIWLCLRFLIFLEFSCSNAELWLCFKVRANLLCKMQLSIGDILNIIEMLIIANAWNSKKKKKTMSMIVSFDAFCMCMYFEKCLMFEDPSKYLKQCNHLEFKHDSTKCKLSQ